MKKPPSPAIRTRPCTPTVAQQWFNMASSPAKPGFGSLSPDICEAILLHLSLEDRGRCMLVCKQMAAVGRGSKVLWRQAPGTTKPGLLLEALEAQPALHVEELAWDGCEYYWPNKPREGDFARPDGVAALGLLQEACVLLGPRLTSLTLQSTGDVSLGSWLLLLTGLTRLELRGCTDSIVEDCVGSLTCLKELCIDPRGDGWLSLADGAHFPPTLTRLDLRAGNEASILGACVPAAGSLEFLRLNMMVGVDAVEFDDAPLGQLTALTRLIWSTGAGLPAEAAALTRLQELTLTNLGEMGDDVEWPEVLTGALTQLRVVEFVTCDLPDGLPEFVATLPQLERLYASYNVYLGGEELPAWMPTIRCLELHATIVLEQQDALSHAVQLVDLRIVDYYELTSKSTSTAEVLELLELLESLPALRSALGLLELVHLTDELHQSMECTRKLIKLARARPELVL